MAGEGDGGDRWLVCGGGTAREGERGANRGGSSVFLGGSGRRLAGDWGRYLGLGGGEVFVGWWRGVGGAGEEKKERDTGEWRRRRGAGTMGVAVVLGGRGSTNREESKARGEHEGRREGGRGWRLAGRLNDVVMAGEGDGGDRWLVCGGGTAREGERGANRGGSSVFLGGSGRRLAGDWGRYLGLGGGEVFVGWWRGVGGAGEEKKERDTGEWRRRRGAGTMGVAVVLGGRGC
ncbi:uncharacterized protein [Spinacia oleracea]|uniref:Uncharacterized protein n=1 Tax=Spinacia oleracea TaxID=3562 RepID=A0ABM3QZN3_SPIOL|nr:uncharacterized protein LOC130463655 [Spinacia oleracea]